MSILPQLEHDLRRAADRRAGAPMAPALGTTPAPTPARRRHRLGALLPFAAALAAIVVAGGALALLGHHGSQPGHHGPPAPSRSTGASPTARPSSPRVQLLGMLGVLRRSQSAVGGEHSMPTPELALLHAAGLGHQRVDRPLVRTVPGPDRSAVELLPASYRSSRTARSFGLLLAIGLPTGAGSFPDRPVGPAVVRAHGAGICTPSKATNLCAIVVPDGVSHVTVGALATHDAVAIKNADAVRASVPVRDNVASFTVPALAASSRTLPRHLYFVDVTADVTWSAGGRAIRHTATPLELTARIGHNAPIPGPDSAIPSAAQCARELASCRAMGP